MLSPFKFELLGILGMGVVTFFIRVLPFLGIIPDFILERLEKKQAVFPTMFLTLLAIYCLAPIQSGPPRDSLILVSCVLVVAFLQWFKGNLLISLGVGTAIYLIALNYLLN